MRSIKQKEDKNYGQSDISKNRTGNRYGSINSSGNNNTSTITGKIDRCYKKHYKEEVGDSNESLFFYILKEAKL